MSTLQEKTKESKNKEDCPPGRGGPRNLMSRAKAWAVAILYINLFFGGALQQTYFFDHP